LVEGGKFSSFHFTGILGSGMSAIAQYLSWEGLAVSGSDRLSEAVETKGTRFKLEQAGCRILPQDGSGVNGMQAVVVSTAIEQDNPDVAAARKWRIPVFHRSDILAAIVASKKTIAVCGTSGKSTVTAMIFEFLTGCGGKPSLLSGAGLVRLEEQGLIGNAFRGDSDLLVTEADESDGTIVKYHPFLSIFLNISKDHKPVGETLALFKSIAANSTAVIANADDPGLGEIEAGSRFGLTANALCRPDSVFSLAPCVQINMGGQTVSLPIPGGHNLSNLLAALCVCTSLGWRIQELARAVSQYKGVARRFQIHSTKRGVLVIDDYAHNPEKIKAALLTAFEFGKRIFAVFQPHGFGPTRFMKNELIEMYGRTLRAQDEAIFLPIYYVGGTALRDISSADLAQAVVDRGASATCCDRPQLISKLSSRAVQGDVVLLMGARDPSLPMLADQIVQALGGISEDVGLAMSTSP